MNKERRVHETNKEQGGKDGKRKKKQFVRFIYYYLKLVQKDSALFR
jgi:hypothetical protein